ncbi:MAG: hypothetical protein KTR24_18475 [Saprospiraceae bacterium]|nr:hypothetical protein [Saprospiraceae bacterium]
MADWCWKGRSVWRWFSPPALATGPYVLAAALLLTVHEGVGAQVSRDSLKQGMSTSLGFSNRVAGSRGLGFYSFSGVVPELVLRIKLWDGLLVGAGLRYSRRSSELAETVIWDPSIYAIMPLGPSGRTFAEGRLRQVSITTSWKAPLSGEERHPTTGFSFGMGRVISISPRVDLVAVMFYEYLKPHLGSWNGGLNIDLGLHYRLENR